MSVLMERVASYLRVNKGEHYSVTELADAIKEHYPDKPLVQLRREISGQFSKYAGTKRFPEIREVEDVTPKRWYWSKENVAELIMSARLPPKSKPKRQRREHDLYDPLIDFLIKKKGVKAFRINEKKAKNKRGAGANWHRYPDVVGVEGIPRSKDWISEIRHLASEMYQEDNAKIWSFEVKLKIANIGELRKAYSQARENSLWAHLGYLCVEDINLDDEKIKKGIQEHKKSHGIGLIIINRRRPLDSYIHALAPERTRIDLDFCNILADENEDFVNFIEYATNIFKTGTIY